MNSLTGSTIDHEEFNTRASLNRTFTCIRKTKNPYNSAYNNGKILISDKKKTYALSPRVGNSFVMGYPKMTMKKKPLEYRYFPYLKKPADKFSEASSIDATPLKHGTEIVTHRIHMAIQRLQDFENNRESIAMKIQKR